MSRKNYSRLARLEEKRNVRSAFLYGGLSLLILIGFFFFGLPAVAKFAGFLTELGGSGKLIEKSDNLSPAPPQIDTLPEFVKESQLTITGTTEAGVTIKLSINTKEEETISDSDGRFNFEVNLQKGENRIFAKAIDQSANVSEQSKAVTVTLDLESPELVIISPKDGASFYGSDHMEITVEGQTEEEVIVEVNGKAASKEDNGKFKITISLSAGSNEITVKAVDMAGNETEKSVSVNYSE